MSGFESPAQGLEMDGELGMDLSHHNYADMLGMNEGEVNLQTNNNILEHPDGNNVSVVCGNEKASSQHVTFFFVKSLRLTNVVGVVCISSS